MECGNFNLGILSECEPINEWNRECGLTLGGAWANERKNEYALAITYSGMRAKWFERRVWTNSRWSVGQVGAKESVG